MVVGVTAAVFKSAVILGIFLGTVYAMMALGIVASFRINRVVNLGIPGIAVFAATVYFQMSTVWGAPVIMALLGGGGHRGASRSHAGLLQPQDGRLAPRLRDDLHADGDAVPLRLVGQDPAARPGRPGLAFGDSGGFNVALAFVSNHQIGTFVTCILVTLLMA